MILFTEKIPAIMNSKTVKSFDLFRACKGWGRALTIAFIVGRKSSSFSVDSRFEQIVMLFSCIIRGAVKGENSHVENIQQINMMLLWTPGWCNNSWIFNRKSTSSSGLFSRELSRNLKRLFYRYFFPAWTGESLLEILNSLDIFFAPNRARWRSRWINLNPLQFLIDNAQRSI